MVLNAEKQAFYRLWRSHYRLAQSAPHHPSAARPNLGRAQQTITAYETGSRRIQVSVLPVIAQALRVSVEELIDGQAKARKRGPTGKVQQQLKQVQQLPRAKQKADQRESRIFANAGQSKITKCQRD